MAAATATVAAPPHMLTRQNTLLSRNGPSSGGSNSSAMAPSKAANQVIENISRIRHCWLRPIAGPPPIVR
jgi:hypothetical protein